MKPASGMSVFLALLLSVSVATANPDLYWDETACTGLPDGALVLHPLDCSLYYTCRDSKPELFICSGSLLFNPLTKQCSDVASIPALTPCLQGASSGLPKEPSVIVDDTSAPNKNEYLPTCINSSSNYLVPHPYECERYFLCYAGTAFPETCPGGLYFNPSREACDLPSNLPSWAECLNLISSTPQPGSSTASPPYMNCTRVPDGTYLPDPFSCEIYYICVNQSPVPEVCPAGLYFNPDTERCVLPADMPSTAPCLQTEPPPTSTTEAVYMPQCENYLDGTYLPHPFLCEAYYICFAGEATLYTCPSGLYFNPLDARCELPQNLPPDTPCLTNPVNRCKVSPDGTYLSDPDDCQAYYVCLNGTANSYDCPPGLYFNPQTNVCVVASQLPPDVPCSPYSTTSTSDTTPWWWTNPTEETDYAGTDDYSSTYWSWNDE